MLLLLNTDQFLELMLLKLKSTKEDQLQLELMLNHFYNTKVEFSLMLLKIKESTISFQSLDGDMTKLANNNIGSLETLGENIGEN